MQYTYDTSNKLTHHSLKLLLYSCIYTSFRPTFGTTSQFGSVNNSPLAIRNHIVLTSTLWIKIRDNAETIAVKRIKLEVSLNTAYRRYFLSQLSIAYGRSNWPHDWLQMSEASSPPLMKILDMPSWALKEPPISKGQRKHCAGLSYCNFL